MTEQMKNLLAKEDSILTAVLEKQSALRRSVNDRDWNTLVRVTAELEDLSERFRLAEKERESLSGGTERDAEELTGLSAVRNKLIRSQAETKALHNYVRIMQGFVQGVIDNALPTSRSKVYGPNGALVGGRPSSVVVDALF